MTIVNNAFYVAGTRVHDERTANEARLHAGGGSTFAWVGLLDPTPEELRDVASRFGLPAQAVSSMAKVHSRSKLDHFDDDLALVVRAAHYIDQTETVEFGDLHIFVSAQAIVTVRLSEQPNLARARSDLEARPQLLARGTRAALWAVLDAVVDTYDLVVDGLENDIDEIEDQIFADDRSQGVSRRIYELHREVMGFQRAARPLIEVVDQVRHSLDEQEQGDEARAELHALFDDLHGHLVRVNDRIENFRALLDNALAAHSAIVAQRQTEVSLAQTEQTKKISAWAAILYLPSMIGAIYGMNFAHMPELHWVWGYPAALALMVASCAGMYAVFKKAGWL